MIIFINGSINSGKSTVSKILAEKISKVAVVEIDSLREFISWMPIDEAIPMNLKNALSVVKNFAKLKLDVIVPYPLSKNNYNFFINGLKEYADDIYVFTLSPKLEIVQTNRGSRELNDWERERIQYHYNNGISNPDFGLIIDNSNESPEETANKILKIIRNI
jgi:broad-specificity NMP kinase